MHFYHAAFITFALMLASGCSDPNLDYGTPIEPGMSIRVMGNTQKRILYHVRQYDIKKNNTSSVWDSGNCQVKQFNNERLEVTLDPGKNGCFANVLVPFDDEVTLELVRNGKVIDSKVSTKAGTILTLELGSVPKDRSTWLTDYELKSKQADLRDSLLDAISSGRPTESEGYSFLKQTVGDKFKSFIDELTKKHGEFRNESSDQWVHVENQNGSMLQGSLTFGKKHIPVTIGTGEDNSIHFIVVEFIPGEDWIPVEQWKTHFEANTETGVAAE